MSGHDARIQQRAFDACIPLNVTLELSLRCNLRCVHCYNFDRELAYLPGRRRDEELRDDEVHRILDEVRAEGCLYLGLTGGEALLHLSLGEFVRHAARSGMAVRIKSNGTLLRPETVRRLAEAGAAAIDLSLYGATAPTHDAFVKVSGAWQRTIEGAQRARDAGLAVKLNAVVAQSNASEVGAMLELAEQLGVSCNLDFQITARYDGSRSSIDLAVDRATLEALHRGPLRHLVPGGEAVRKSIQCSCARSVCGISSFGDVYPCISAPIRAGDLREQSFHEVWTQSPQFHWIRGLTHDDFPACRSCAHQPYCRRSSGEVYSNTGMYNGPARFGDDFACMEAEVLHHIHDTRAD
jgi:radical SAM protein with 4Fe4S-binding SPASM domain